ncbi:MAG TPA: hypothetical protein DCF45_03585, partial [Gammaproteobacteria bacterium]|nr:hypothetical protein [Gammaproteobacteria bacterium]
MVYGTYLFLATVALWVGHLVGPSPVVGQVITCIGSLVVGGMLTRDGVVDGVSSAAATWLFVPRWAGRSRRAICCSRSS